MLGERPTHPELLDTLTCRFIESGWSLKALHREIMLSATYQLSSDDDEHNLNIDARQPLPLARQPSAARHRIVARRRC